MDTFRHLRILHELIELLTVAESLDLPTDVEQQRTRLLGAICPVEMSEALAETLATGPLPQRVRSFLKSLAAHAPPPPTENPAPEK